MTEFRRQKCVYFYQKTLEKSLEKAQNEQVSFSQFINRCVKFYLDNHKDLFDVDSTDSPKS